MSLLRRLIGLDSPKIAVHQFMAALAEYKRSAPNVTLAAIATALNIPAGQEQTDLAFIANLYVTDVITREMIHDVLLLGEETIYDEATCLSRLLTAGTPNLGPTLLQHSIDALKIGVNDFTLAGCAVTAQGSPDMTVAVAKGSVMSGGVLLAVTAGNVTIPAANASLPRLDLVVVASNGTKTLRQGTPMASPVVTGYQVGDVLLSIVYVPPGTTSIDSGKLRDVRVVEQRGPITVGKITTAVVKNNTSAQQTFVSLTLPSGLFLAGKILEVDCGGTMLLNSGTPTVTLLISYGGTTMFADVTGTATADTDRLAWNLNFRLTAQANNDQALNGNLTIGPVAAKTAPTTGTGDISVPALLASSPVPAPINGASAVDSDAGDRILLIAWTMNVANAANEIVMEHAVARLE